MDQTKKFFLYNVLAIILYSATQSTVSSAETYVGVEYNDLIPTAAQVTAPFPTADHPGYPTPETPAPSPRATPLQTPSTTPSPTPTDCVCSDITIICLDQQELNRICGSWSVEGCAKQDICTLYIKKGAPQCTQIVASNASVQIPASRIPISPSVKQRSNSPWSGPSGVAYVAMTTANEIRSGALDKSALITDADSTPPSQWDLHFKCLVIHETDHLCRKTKAGTPCEVEPSALAAQAKCFADAIDAYCRPTESNPQPNPGLCAFACRSIAGYNARTSFSQCFCATAPLPTDPDTEKERSCCQCANKCPLPDVPEACGPYADEVAKTLNTTCPLLIDPSAAHSCKHYGNWSPPWDTRIPRCDQFNG